MRNYQESLNVIITQLYPQGFEYTLQVPCLIFEGPQKLFCLFSAITKSPQNLTNAPPCGENFYGK